MHITEFPEVSQGLSVAELERYFEQRGQRLVRGQNCPVRKHGFYRLEKSRRCIHCAYNRDKFYQQEAERLGKIYVPRGYTLGPIEREWFRAHMTQQTASWDLMYDPEGDKRRASVAKSKAAARALLPKKRKKKVHPKPTSENVPVQRTRRIYAEMKARKQATKERIKSRQPDDLLDSLLSA